MNFPLRYKYLAFSFLLLCALFNSRAQSGILPADYQKKLLVPEPILQQYNSTTLPDIEAVSPIIVSVYRGDSLFLSGNLDLARSVYNEGHRLAEESGDIWLSVLLGNRLGFSNYWLMNFQSAGENYFRSLELITNATEIEDTLLLLESIVFFRKCNDMLPVTGEDYSLSKYSGYIENEPIGMKPARAAKYQMMQALWYHDEINFLEVKRDLKNADEQLSLSNQNQEFWLFLVRYYQAELYRQLNDYDLVKEFLTKLTKQVNEESHFSPYRYFIYFLQCELSFTQGDFKKAEYYANKIAPYIYKKTYPYFLQDRLLLGWTYQGAGNSEKALKYYLEAIQLLDINSIQDERLAKVYWYLANFHRTVLSDTEMSYHYLQLAETVLNDHPDFYMESFVYYDLGNYYFYRKDFDLAIITFNMMLDDLDQLISDDDYFKIRYPHIIRSRYLLILEKRAKAFYYLSKSKNFDLISLKSSFRDFKDLLLLQKKVFEETGFEESKISVLKALRHTSNNLLNVGYTLYEENRNDSLANELFEILEGGKAYMLKKYTSDIMAKRIAGIPEELIEQSRILQKEIDTLQYSFRSTDINLGTQRENFLVNKILNKQDIYREFVKRLESEYPKYAELKKNSRNISMNDIQQRLLNDQVFIDYYYNHNSLYLFYIDKDTIQIVYTPVDKTLPDKFQEYRRLFENMKFGDFDSKTIQEFSDRSFGIFSIVLQPVQKNILGKRLLIVPDGELNFIPFESLVIEKINGSFATINYGDLKYLVLQNPISYLYSASQLMDSHNSPRRKVRFAGFAPDYSKLHNDIGQQDSIYTQLSDLPGAYNEVLSAVKYFKGDLFTGEDLEKNQFFKANIRDDIVHLAMHTILDEDEPMNSELVISTNPQKVNPQLRAYEVYSKRNSTSLVVLSACSTGSGRLSGGEGVFSIARAFIGWCL
jgi:CHAT domain-containing protein